MIKNLRYFISCALLSLVAGVNAQSVFNIDADYATLFPTLKGVSSSASSDGSKPASSDGDFTEITTSTPVDGITLTVSPKEEGQSNANRIWSSSPRLRMYSGTLTITAPAGKNMQKIEFSGHEKNFNLSTETGTLTGKTWEGNANTIVFKVAKNTQISTITIALEGEEIKSIENTPETAYTVAEANAIIAKGVGLDTEVYVKGIIYNIKEVSTQYGNATYTLTDDATGQNTIVVYRGYYLNGDKFTAEGQINVGDEVIVYGKLMNYNGTSQIAQGSKIYSITTGISDITADKAEKDGAIYNLAGQRMEKMQKGINIVNGKKYVVK